MASHERQLTTIAIVTSLPAVVVAMVLLWTGDVAARTQWTLTLLVLVVWVAAQSVDDAGLGGAQCGGTVKRSGLAGAALDSNRRVRGPGNAQFQGALLGVGFGQQAVG